MKISVHQSGGCFGIPRRATIDTDGATDPQIQAENRLLEAMAVTALLDRPRSHGASSAPRITITVEYGGHVQSVTHDSMNVPPNARALVDAVFHLFADRGLGGDAGGAREIA